MLYCSEYTDGFMISKQGNMSSITYYERDGKSHGTAQI